MYRMSLGKEYIDEMVKSFNSGKDVYRWCLLDETNLKYIHIPEEGNYYTSYFKGIEENVPDIKKFYVKENMAIHSPGSFVWYDMKNIYNHIGNNIYKISLDSEMLKSVDSARHYCELYIWRFLKLENIQEQTFINNMRKQFSSIMNSSYTQLYCSKKICKEYIKDFDKYFISNYGRVKSTKYKTERILKTVISGRCKYVKVILRKDNKNYTKMVHRLVAEAFLDNPYNLSEVNHKDENKQNNIVSNLEWISHIDNIRYGNCREKIRQGKINYHKKNRG